MPNLYSNSFGGSARSISPVTYRIGFPSLPDPDQAIAPPGFKSTSKSAPQKNFLIRLLRNKPIPDLLHRGGDVIRKNQWTFSTSMPPGTSPAPNSANPSRDRVHPHANGGKSIEAVAALPNRLTCLSSRRLREPYPRRSSPISRCLPFFGLPLDVEAPKPPISIPTLAESLIVGDHPAATPRVIQRRVSERFDLD